MTNRKKSAKNRRGQRRTLKKWDPREVSAWVMLTFVIVKVVWWLFSNV
ncbi:hypothetical protein [Streptomyces sp. NRRL S-241]|nr:hypothetical protein [Streptomyces sp. NRRL S-241]